MTVIENAPLEPTQRSGFTLIEMSIVLVIIGFIVGGVLTGQSLIKASEVRATVTQVEKYQTATNTFRDKFNGLPGDLNAASATQFGFANRGTLRGEGDSNGVIEGCAGGIDGSEEGCGETALFWEDLSYAHLIDGQFNTGIATASLGTVTGTGLNSYFPQAKLGNGNYIYVWSGGIGSNLGSGDNRTNYFGIAAITKMNGWIDSTLGLTVQQAYAIDTKVDDGLPQTGRVVALYDNYGIQYPDPGSIGWATTDPSGQGANAGSPNYGPTNAPTPYSNTNCYDNNNVTGAQQYSIAKNANLVNCALSFEFQ